MPCKIPRTAAASQLERRDAPPSLRGTPSARARVHHPVPAVASTAQAAVTARRLPNSPDWKKAFLSKRFRRHQPMSPRPAGARRARSCADGRAGPFSFRKRTKIDKFATPIYVYIYCHSKNWSRKNLMFRDFCFRHPLINRCRIKRFNFNC